MTAQPSTIYLLLGYPGTGKYTVAKAMAAGLEQLGRTTRVVDNHYVNNPVFGLVEQDGVGHLPEGLWDRVGEVRNALLATIESLSPANWTFIFTNWIAETEAEGASYIDRLKAIARTRGSDFECVRLTCDPEELRRRVVAPDRRERMKWTDSEGVLRLTETHPLLDPGPPAFTIDNTELEPAECAAEILRRASAGPTASR